MPKKWNFKHSTERTGCIQKGGFNETKKMWNGMLKAEFRLFHGTKKKTLKIIFFRLFNIINGLTQKSNRIFSIKIVKLHPASIFH